MLYNNAESLCVFCYLCDITNYILRRAGAKPRKKNETKVSKVSLV